MPAPEAKPEPKPEPKPDFLALSYESPLFRSIGSPLYRTAGSPWITPAIRYSPYRAPLAYSRFNGYIPSPYYGYNPYAANYFY